MVEQHSASLRSWCYAGASRSLRGFGHPICSLWMVLLVACDVIVQEPMRFFDVTLFRRLRAAEDLFRRWSLFVRAMGKCPGRFIHECKHELWIDFNARETIR